MKSVLRLLSLAAFAAAPGLAIAQSVTASFDDLPSPPPLNGATGLVYANDGSSTYQGVGWDSRFVVVGDEARVDTVTPGPLFGMPHSGHYFVRNEGDGAANDGLMITTSLVLTGAWFGRNEYYGYGAGADQVTLNAMHDDVVLAAVVFDLPAPAVEGQPGVMGYVDTQAFAALQGITGYRIDRRETGALNGNWVADDFSFETSAVPEPAAPALLLAGLGALALSRRRAAAATSPR